MGSIRPASRIKKEERVIGTGPRGILMYAPSIINAENREVKTIFLTLPV